MESDTESEYDYTIKLLVLGDTNVGKTKFIIRFSENKFQEEYMATIGIDLKFSTIEIKGKKIRVQMWDTAGQEKYRSITKNLFLKVQGILALYDITNDITFENTGSAVVRPNEISVTNSNNITIFSFFTRCL